MQRRWEDLTGKLSYTFLASRMLFEEVFQLKDVKVKTDGNAIPAMASLSCLWEHNWVEAVNSVGTTMSLVIDELSMMFSEFKPCPRCGQAYARKAKEMYSML